MAIVRIQRWVRRMRDRRNQQAKINGTLEESYSLGDLDSDTFERRRSKLEETRDFLSSYGKNSTFSNLMATMNSLLRDD